MQRKEIDRDEYETIKAGLTETIEVIWPVTTTEGGHEGYGSVIKIGQGGRFFVEAEL